MAVDNFGARTDHFGLETQDLVLVDSSAVKVAESVERAEDENGDFADEEKHGQNAEGDLAEASCTYALKSGTLNLNTLKIGEKTVGNIITSLEATTSNGAWPQIVVAGQINAETVTAPPGKKNTWTIKDSIELVGAKRAQLMDFTIGVGCRLTGSSYSASVDVASQADGLGIIVAHGVSGGVVQQTAEMVRITAACTWIPGETWLEEQKPGSEEPQANFEVSGTATASKILARDETGL